MLTDCHVCLVDTQILDETSAAVAALETQQWQENNERSMEYAEQLAAKAAEVVKAHFRNGEDNKEDEPFRVAGHALQPNGGASDVGASVCAFARDHQVSLEK